MRIEMPNLGCSRNAIAISHELADQRVRISLHAHHLHWRLTPEFRGHYCGHGASARMAAQLAMAAVVFPWND